MLEETVLRQAIVRIDTIREDRAPHQPDIDNIVRLSGFTREDSRAAQLEHFCGEYDALLFNKLFGQYIAFEDYRLYRDRKVTPSRAYMISYPHIAKNAIWGSTLGIFTDSLLIGIGGAAAGAAITVLDELKYYATMNISKVYAATVIAGAVAYEVIEWQFPIAPLGAEFRAMVSAGLTVGFTALVEESYRAGRRALDIAHQLQKIHCQYWRETEELIRRYTTSPSPGKVVHLSEANQKP